MKAILYGIIISGFVTGCVSKEIQVDIVSAELISIDTVTRFSNVQKQLLTWKVDNNTMYITFVPLEQSYHVGTRIAVLRPTR